MASPLPTPLSRTTVVLLSVFFSLIAVAAGYCMIYIQVLNDTIPTLQLLVSSPLPKLPGASPAQPLVTRFTGFKPLDGMLVNLVTFYWWAADGGYPRVSLFGIWMVGQLLLPLTVLLLLEGWRAGHKGSILAFSITWQLLWQFIPWAVILSIYAIITINTSPLLHATAVPVLASHLHIPTPQLRALPWSLTFGFLFPTLLIMLPSPRFTSYALHQQILGYWQLYPLYVFIFQFISTRLLASSKHHVPVEQKLASTRATKYDLSPLRMVYIFAITFSTLIHVAILSISLNSVLFPSLFAPGIAAEFHPMRVFLPLSPLAPPKMVTLAEGCLNLLQWDSVFVSILGLFLAGVAYTCAGRGNGVMDILCKGVGLSVLAGPGSTALLTLWRRDETVFGAVYREGSVKEL